MITKKHKLSRGKALQWLNPTSIFLTLFIFLAVMSLPWPLAVAQSQETTLNDISFSRISGNRVQVNLALSDQVPTPQVFRTIDPPRIVFDFTDVKNQTGKSSYKVNIASVDDLLMAQSDHRLRLVLNLLRPADYNISRIKDDLVLTVGTNISSVAAVSSAKQIATKANQLPTSDGQKQGMTKQGMDKNTDKYMVTGIDFRRTPQGAGRVTVDLADDKLAVDIQEQAGEIIALFPNASLPAELEQRLDVIDFATPVSTIDIYNDGKDIRMVIMPVGQYKHSTVQSSGKLMIEIAPLSEAEEIAKKTDEFGYKGERLSLNFQRISVRAALQVIADFTGINFVTSDAISGDLSLRLKDVPWDQALDVILQTKGLAKRQKGNVIWIAPADEIAAKEKQVLEANQEVVELAPLVSELIGINYAKAKDVANILKSIKTVESNAASSAFGSVTYSEVKTIENSLLSERGSVTVDKRTNSLLVQETAIKMREIRDLINKLDVPVRQVQIETRIIQANENFSRNIGARLGFTRLTRQAKFPGIKGSNLGDVYGSGSIGNTNRLRTKGLTEVNNDALSVNLPAGAIGIDRAGSYAFTLAKLGSGYLNLLDLEISALQAEGNGRILANPKILTTDKHKAQIEQGQERLTTFGSAFGTPSTKGQRAVLSLTVTPQITPDDKITLDVEIKNDSFVASNVDTVNTKRISTQVLLENGETVVIGGIYTREQSDSESKVPLLGDIPLLGRLFKKKTARDDRSELLVFLTPRILDPTLVVQ